MKCFTPVSVAAERRQKYHIIPLKNLPTHPKNTNFQRYWVLDDYKRQWSRFIERFFVFFESLLDRSNPIAYTKYIYIYLGI